MQLSGPRECANCALFRSTVPHVRVGAIWRADRADADRSEQIFVASETADGLHTVGKAFVRPMAQAS